MYVIASDVFCDLENPVIMDPKYYFV